MHRCHETRSEFVGLTTDDRASGNRKTIVLFRRRGPANLPLAAMLRFTARDPPRIVRAGGDVTAPPKNEFGENELGENDENHRAPRRLQLFGFAAAVLVAGRRAYAAAAATSAL